MALKPTTKSFILSLTVFVANFIGYITYRPLFGFGSVTFWEGVGFTIYDSIIGAVLVFIVSYILFKMKN